MCLIDSFSRFYCMRVCMFIICSNCVCSVLHTVIKYSWATIVCIRWKETTGSTNNFEKTNRRKSKEMKKSRFKELEKSAVFSFDDRKHFSWYFSFLGCLKSWHLDGVRISVFKWCVKRKKTLLFVTLAKISLDSFSLYKWTSSNHAACEVACMPSYFDWSPLTIINWTFSIGFSNRKPRPV